MTAINHFQSTPFTVICGGKRSAKPAKTAGTDKTRSNALPRLRRPAMSADRLACEMGRIYALTLLRDIPFADFRDPQRAVWIDAATRFTLHELQTELCRLPWPPGHPVPAASVAALPDMLSLGMPGDADGVRGTEPYKGRSSDPSALSDFFETVPPRFAGPVGTALSVPGVSDPGPSQPLSHWQLWIEAASGARLPVPGRSDSAARTLHTPRDLAVQVHRRHPCQPYFSAALQLLASGMPVDDGLRQSPGGLRWDGPRVLSLLLNGARRAEALCRRGARGSRLSRPGVIATRWSLMQSGEEMRSCRDSVLEQAALDIFKAAAPRLLHWVARMNRAAGTGGYALPTSEGGSCDGWTPLEFRQNLMLPPLDTGSARLCPSQGAGQAVLAGTMVTLLKAMFCAVEPARAVREDHVRELDRLASNIVLGRSIVGGFYEVENRQGLQLGQSLGLTLLREVLEEDGAAATMKLSDFDERQISLTARRNGPGMVRVILQVDGAHAPWPDSGDRTVPHLTAVV